VAGGVAAAGMCAYVPRQGWGRQVVVAVVQQRVRYLLPPVWQAGVWQQGGINVTAERVQQQSAMGGTRTTNGNVNR